MKKIHYGWIVVIIAFFSMLIAAAIRSTSGVILVPLEEEFGWSRSAISLAFAINLVLYGFSGPFFAAYLERFGVRKVMVYAMTLLVVGTAFSTQITSVLMLQFLWGIVIGLGSGVFLTVLSPTIANRWFVKNRGLVVGLLMASTATGQLAFLPLLSYIVQAFTWKTALLIVSGTGLLFIPLIAIFIRNYPKDVNLTAYGATEIESSQPVSLKNPITMAFNGLKIGVRSFDFWLLSASFFICGLTTSGLIGTHFIPACIDHGIAEVTAAGLLALMGIFDILGVTLSGWLSDRINNRWLLFWYYSFRGLALLVLPYALITESYILLVGFAIFYGLDWIATVPPTVNLVTDVFGKENSGIIYGWIFAAHQLGAGVAAFGGGVMHSIFSNYTLTFILAGIMCLMAPLIVLRIGRRKKEVLLKAS